MATHTHPPPPIRFHFDPLSPYAYLAWTQLPALAARHGRAVEPVPTLLAGLLAHGHTRGPAEIPAKRAYIFKDVVRSAHRLGVPLAPPPHHPFNPLLALRAATVVEGEPRIRLVDALFHAAWGGGDGVEGPERIARAARQAGLDGDAIVAAASAEPAKAALRAATEAAIAAGVFGVPTMAVDGELFWGLDSFGHLERYLEGDDPFVTGAVGPAVVERWAATVPSATRRLG